MTVLHKLSTLLLIMAATAAAWGQSLGDTKRSRLAADSVGGTIRNAREPDIRRMLFKEPSALEAYLRRRLEALRWYQHSIGGSLSADAAAVRRAISDLEIRLSLRASYGRQPFWIKTPRLPGSSPSPTHPVLRPPPRDFTTYGVRFIAAIPKEMRLRATITASLTQRLVMGWEFTPRRVLRWKFGHVNVLSQWLAVPETELRPALIVGTGADRLGTPSGQSFYFTINKQVGSIGRVALYPYAGASYGTFDDRLRPIGGLNLALSEHVNTRFVFDGVHLNSIGNARVGRHDFYLLLVRSRDAGFGYSVTF